ncbi:MAG: ankyrin repeat domain-containing protein [Acidobacteriota bacterium]
MSTLPERSSVEHLRKQAKDLLRQYRLEDAAAFERLRQSLPSARNKSNPALIALQLRLHDMQSCIAREYGFSSWVELKDYVELEGVLRESFESRRLHWLRLVYGADVAGGTGRPRPALAARLLAETPELAGDDPYLACAIGDEGAIRRAIDRDAGWVNRSGGLLNIPPLIAITHSGLAGLDPYREALYRSVRLLLDAQADPNASFGNRWPPHSLEKPGDERLTAIYGAAGKLHDVTMTEMLLAAGADPNDGESLYHSLEDPRRELPCTRLLLEGGARVPGTNALAKVLDFDNLAGLKMLLAHTEQGDPDLGRILHWAIYRGRSAAHVRALLDAGADPRTLHSDGQSAHRRAGSFGLPEVVRLLEEGGNGEPLSLEEKFVAACARVDKAEARELLAAKPDLFASLSAGQLRQLPNLAMGGSDDAVRLMVELGWPIAVRGGDIDGSALNWAVFRGNPALAEFLLEHGASFRESHGYGSDVIGTLSWASLNEPRVDGDWPGCAAALLAHGMPGARPTSDPDPSAPNRTVLIDGRTMTFAAEVVDVLLGTGGE